MSRQLPTQKAGSRKREPSVCSAGFVLQFPGIRHEVAFGMRWPPKADGVLMPEPKGGRSPHAIDPVSSGGFQKGLQLSVHSANRQSHNVEIISLNVCNVPAEQSLDAICACLIHRLP